MSFVPGEDAEELRGIARAFFEKRSPESAVRELMETADGYDPAVGVRPRPQWVRCKRACFNDQYLQTFNRPNVTLVDTDGQGVERISETSIFACGEEFPVDCIIYATGFEALTTPARAGDVEVVGRDGKRLEQKWKRVETLHGVSCNGFPNMFVLGGIRHAPITINVTYMITEQSLHVTELISQLLGRGARTVEVTRDAELRWADVIAAKALPGGDADACTPGGHKR